MCVVKEPDDDEVTNSQASPRSSGGQGSSSSGGQCHTATSRWNVDGDEVANNEIEVR